MPTQPLRALTVGRQKTRLRGSRHTKLVLEQRRRRSAPPRSNEQHADEAELIW